MTGMFTIYSEASGEKRPNMRIGDNIRPKSYRDLSNPSQTMFGSGLPSIVPSDDNLARSFSPSERAVSKPRRGRV